ncbi:MAG: UDP-N-acetylmuramoyl-tripeptide--D-alanyl-D-alanine ligase [Chitinophagales bacterium]
MDIKTLYNIYLEANDISTDSRNIKTGDLFFALKGENFNGNKFALKALENGASKVIVDDPDFALDERFLVVENVLETLQDLAAYHRKQLAVPVIAIAGSNGKTTTKELMAAVLNTSYKTSFTQGNYNNEIGLPLTLLNIKQDAELIILEMGARKRGDIAFLCEIATPTHGLITNIGKDHIEFFGSVENTLKANAELFDYLKANAGVVFVNPEHKALIEAAKEAQTIIRYGETPGVEYPGRIESGHPYVHFAFLIDDEWMNCETQLVGTYNLENLMAAVAVGHYFKVPSKKICEAIKAYQAKNNRSQLIQFDSNTVILDAYNANPSSMELALKSFDEIEHPKKMLVLGDMLELGDTSEEEHLLTILQIKQMQVDKIILVGEEFGKLKHKVDCLHFNDYKELKDWFNLNLPQDYLILVKGSRGISLEKVFLN